MSNKVEPFNVTDANLVHAGGSTGRIEFDLGDGRVATIPCDIERKKLTEAPTQKLTARPGVAATAPAVKPQAKAASKPLAAEDDLLARERKAHEAADAQSRKTAKLEVGGTVGVGKPTPPPSP